MKNLTRQNPGQLFVAQELINKVKSKCCGIKDNIFLSPNDLALVNKMLKNVSEQIKTIEVKLNNVVMLIK